VPDILSLNPKEIREHFLKLQTAADVAGLLEIKLSKLTYLIYKVPSGTKYTTFQIPKKTGGMRTISSPNEALKFIQRRLNYVLLHVYKPKPSVHSYLIGKSIVSHAHKHKNKINLLTIDLQDFFPSINFARVRGMFIGKPYYLGVKAATILAQICCFNNELPQGAPTSPIISNMICAQMDSQLTALAKEHDCYYSRYADDLTFSTNLRKFPSAFMLINQYGQIEVGTELKDIITSNWFVINLNKIHLQHCSRRQQVTGLIVNKFPNVRRKYIRNLRATLHSWSLGYEEAEKQLHEKYVVKHRNPLNGMPSLKNYVKGKFSYLKMVRLTRDKDSVYLGLLKRLNKLDPGLIKLDSVIGGKALSKPLIFTEGKTDIKHLKAAQQKLKLKDNKYDIEIDFKDDGQDRGNGELEKLVMAAQQMPHSSPVIFVFDRDDPKYVKNMVSEGKDYKNWGNNAFSMVLPIPPNRKANPDVCIELYYIDSDIQIVDTAGRRLYLNSEFDKDTLKLKVDGRINFTIPKIIKDYVYNHKLKIIDDAVFDETGKNIALSKEDYANCVVTEAENFQNVDFSNFSIIFDVIIQILNEALAG